MPEIPSPKSQVAAYTLTSRDIPAPPARPEVDPHRVIADDIVSLVSHMRDLPSSNLKDLIVDHGAHSIVEALDRAAKDSSAYAFQEVYRGVKRHLDERRPTIGKVCTDTQDVVRRLLAAHVDAKSVIDGPH